MLRPFKNGIQGNSYFVLFLFQGGPDPKAEKKIKLLTEQSATLKRTIQESQDKIRQMEKDLKEAKSGGSADVSKTYFALLLFTFVSNGSHLCL